MRTVVLVNSALSLFGGAISVASVARARWTAPGSVNRGNQFPKFGEHVLGEKPTRLDPAFDGTADHPDRQRRPRDFGGPGSASTKCL
jgi:hypothetical protein